MTTSINENDEVMITEERKHTPVIDLIDDEEIEREKK